MPIIVYAIIDLKRIADISILTNLLFKNFGIHFDSISTSELGAIISTGTPEAISINRESVLKYAAIIDYIAQNYSILPLRYGSIVATVDEGISLLVKNNDIFLTTLHKIYNKEEYSIRVFISQRHQDSTIITTLPTTTSNIPQILLGTTKSKNYLLKKFQTHVKEESKKAYFDQLKSVFIGDLQRLTHLLDFKKNPSPECIMDVVLLIERSKRADLVAMVADMQLKHPEHNIILTGPWPPYNFTQIKIQ